MTHKILLIYIYINLRVSLKIAIVDGFNQLFSHLYYLLFTSCKQREEEVVGRGGRAHKRGHRLSGIIWRLKMHIHAACFPSTYCLTFEISSTHGNTASGINDSDI